MKFPTLLFLIAASALLPPLLPAGAPPSLRPPSRDRLVREPAARIGGRLLIPAFFRPGERSGYLWVEDQIDDYGRYFPGYWEPVGPYARKGGEMVWVPGRFEDGRWFEGYWRVPGREGFTWFNGYFDENGRRHEPGWQPNEPILYFPDGPARSDDVRLSRAAHPRWGYKETIPP
jgi:hypothetical protein